jgi:hypothetical protein
MINVAVDVDYPARVSLIVASWSLDCGGCVDPVTSEEMGLSACSAERVSIFTNLLHTSVRKHQKGESSKMTRKRGKMKELSTNWNRHLLSFECNTAGCDVEIRCDCIFDNRSKASQIYDYASKLMKPVLTCMHCYLNRSEIVLE